MQVLLIPQNLSYVVQLPQFFVELPSDSALLLLDVLLEWLGSALWNLINELLDHFQIDFALIHPDRDPDLSLCLVLDLLRSQEAFNGLFLRIEDEASEDSLPCGISLSALLLQYLREQVYIVINLAQTFFI